MPIFGNCWKNSNWPVSGRNYVTAIPRTVKGILD